MLLLLLRSLSSLDSNLGILRRSILSSLALLDGHLAGLLGGRLLDVVLAGVGLIGSGGLLALAATRRLLVVAAASGGRSSSTVTTSTTGGGRALEELLLDGAEAGPGARGVLEAANLGELVKVKL